MLSVSNVVLTSLGRDLLERLLRQQPSPLLSHQASTRLLLVLVLRCDTAARCRCRTRKRYCITAVRGGGARRSDAGENLGSIPISEYIYSYHDGALVFVQRTKAFLCARRRILTINRTYLRGPHLAPIRVWDTFLGTSTLLQQCSKEYLSLINFHNTFGVRDLATPKRPSVRHPHTAADTPTGL